MSCYSSSTCLQLSGVPVALFYSVAYDRVDYKTRSASLSTVFTNLWQSSFMGG